MTTSQPSKFWEVTVSSAKESVRLYFDPLLHFMTWVREMTSSRIFPLWHGLWAIPRFMLWRGLTFLVYLRLKPVEPITYQQAAQHSELIRVHSRMLSMTPEELASRAGLLRLEAEFIMENPDFVPLQEVQQQVRKALMVGETWPRGGYGDEYSKQRLLWYARKGYTLGTAQQIDDMSPEIRGSLLESIEWDLRRRFDTGPQESKHPMPEGVEVKVKLSSLAGEAVSVGTPDSLLGQLEKYLKIFTQGPTQERDRLIFWLHYREGMSSSEIAQIPAVNLSAKGVESVLFRVTRGVRELMIKDRLAAPKELGDFL